MRDASKFIEPNELRQRLNRGERVVVVDVRSADEFLADHIDGAVNIPAYELTARARELPRDATFVTVCNLGGARSCGAAEQLQGLGYSGAKPLRGGVRDWKGKE